MSEGQAAESGILVDFGAARECRRFDETLEKTSTTLQTTSIIGEYCKIPHALAEMYLNRALDLMPESDPTKPFATTFESDNARALYDNVEALSRLDHLLNGADGYKDVYGADVLARGAARDHAAESGKLVHLMPVSQRENFALAASILDNLEGEVADPSYLSAHYISRAIGLLRHYDLNLADGNIAQNPSDAPRGARAVASSIELIRAQIHGFQNNFGADRVMQVFDQVAEDLGPALNARVTSTQLIPS
ncbi:MAG: hypothetical protein AB7E85_08670 [Pseudobdellovibrionaceae bacterium]